jgi:pimeloyl-ACP methyl ester carboxylesterase
MCGIICCFGCLTCLGCRDKVCQRLVFFPPQPFYAIEERHGAQTMWLVEEGQRIEPYTSPNMRLAFVHTSRQSTIATLWLRYPGATTTVLFSHGNATDLGCMRNHLVDFARQLQVNVLAYDYTGYGLSAGPGPTMAHTLSDVEAAYDYLLRTYPNESARIIVYGQSIGSGPTLHLARNRRCNGVVVHSGIMSALRVIQPAQQSTRWFDIFPNVDLVASVPACVFVIHGTADKEIPVEHGQGLAAAAPNSFPAWWVEGAGHNNVEVDFREAYFAQLDQFVRFVEQSTPHIEETEDPRAAAPAKEQRGAASASAGKKQPAVRASIEMQTYNKKGLGSSSSSSNGNGSDPRSMQSPKLPPNHQPTSHRQSFDQI